VRPPTQTHTHAVYGGYQQPQPQQVTAWPPTAALRVQGYGDAAAVMAWAPHGLPYYAAPHPEHTLVPVYPANEAYTE